MASSFRNASSQELVTARTINKLASEQQEMGKKPPQQFSSPRLLGVAKAPTAKCEHLNLSN